MISRRMAVGTIGHKVFIGGLHTTTTGEEVKEKFSQYGPIFSVSVDTPTKYGFITFFNRRDAEKAIEDFDGKYSELTPYRARVEWAYGWPVDNYDLEIDPDEYEEVYNSTCNNRTVYIGDLPSINTDRNFLHSIFSQYGVIEDLRYFEDRNFAFIRYTTKESAAFAICHAEDMEINGSTIVISWSHRPHFHEELAEANASSTSSDSSSSSESSHSPSPDMYNDQFDRILSLTSPNNRTIYIGNLNPLTTDETLRCVFSPYGDIESLTKISSYSTFTDYAFIRYSTKISAALAICAANDIEIDNNTIRCNWSYRSDSPTPDVEDPTRCSPPPSAFVPSCSTQTPPQAAACSLPLPEDTKPKDATNTKEKKIDLLCKICMDEELGMVFLPCGHLASCAKCAQKIETCPMCRKRITGKVRTYLS